MLREYIAVDLEMTGLRPARDKILEIGGVHRKDGKTLAEYQVIVNPGLRLSEEISALTGISQEMAEEGEALSDALAGFLEFRGELPLVGHNIRYDYSFLKQNAANLNLSLEAHTVDTLKLARKFLTEEEKKTLEALRLKYGIQTGQAHRALGDARAAAQLLERLWQEYGTAYPELFEPKPLCVKVKKQGPITPRQKKHLKDLTEYHKIELSVSLDSLTRNEASRLIDRILSQYGRNC